MNPKTTKLPEQSFLDYITTFVDVEFNPKVKNVLQEYLLTKENFESEVINLEQYAVKSIELVESFMKLQSNSKDLLLKYLNSI